MNSMRYRTSTIFFFLLVITCASCGSVKPAENNSTVKSTSPDFEWEDPEKCLTIEVPSAFSPNGDQVHDDFEIRTYCKFTSFEFTILNRWGNEVYKTTDQFFKWNGLDSNAAPVADGTYFYMCSYGYDGGKHASNGNITIIR
jgi:gliding motility-associated-like protein